MLIFLWGVKINGETGFTSLTGKLMLNLILASVVRNVIVAIYCCLSASTIAFNPFRC